MDKGGIDLRLLLGSSICESALHPAPVEPPVGVGLKARCLLGPSLTHTVRFTYQFLRPNVRTGPLSSRESVISNWTSHNSSTRSGLCHHCYIDEIWSEVLAWHKQRTETFSCFCNRGNCLCCDFLHRPTVSNISLLPCFATSKLRNQLFYKLTAPLCEWVACCISYQVVYYYVCMVAYCEECLLKLQRCFGRCRNGWHESVTHRRWRVMNNCWFSYCL